MIWRLALAQLRAHRSYFAWTVSLMTLLVAVLTYVVVAGATQAQISQQAGEMVGLHLDRAGNVTVVEEEGGALHNPVTPSELSAMIDSTPGSMAFASTYLGVKPYDHSTGEIQSYLVLGAYGDHGLDSLLIEGRYPTTKGEVALGWSIAEEIGVNLGEAREFYKVGWNPELGETFDIPLTLTVVGITSDRAPAGYDHPYIPTALVAWDEIASGGVLTEQVSTSEGLGATAAWVDMRWEGASPALDPYLEYEGGFVTGDIALPQSTGVWLVLAAALIVSMIVMSFAMGRAQAAARTGWIATARTLGATRRYIAWSTVVETFLMAAVALVTGVVAGIAAAQIHLSVAVAGSPTAFGPQTVVLHWAILPTVVASTLVVSLAIAAVPAFWASRVSPVAALKPVNDITEAEISRRVSPHWLWVPLGSGAGMIALAPVGKTHPNDFLVMLGVITASVGLIGLMVEAARWAVPAVGRVLTRSSHQAVLSAGHAMTGRPRLAVAPTLISMFAAATLTLPTLITAKYAEQTWWFLARPGGPFAKAWRVLLDEVTGTAILAVLIGIVTIQLVASAIFVSVRSSTARESATRRALGLSSASERTSQWIQQVTPQAVGAALGLVFGAASFSVWGFLYARFEHDPFDMSAPYWLAGLGLSAVAVLVLVVVGGAVAFMVASLHRVRSPIGALHTGT